MNHFGLEASNFVNISSVDKFNENSSRPGSVLINLKNYFNASELLARSSMLQSFKGVFQEQNYSSFISRSLNKKQQELEKKNWQK